MKMNADYGDCGKWRAQESASPETGQAPSLHAFGSKYRQLPARATAVESRPGEVRDGPFSKSEKGRTLGSGQAPTAKGTTLGWGAELGWTGEGTRLSTASSED